jgi:integrase
MFAALRIDMARTIRWNALSLGGKSITWQQKNGIENVLPVHHELRRVLAETPRVAVTVVASEFGRPYRGGLAKAFRTLIVKLTAEDQVRPGLTFHGLRHTAGKRLAELGVDPRTIAAMLGDKTPAMGIYYSEEVDRRQRAVAAVTALEQPQNTISRNFVKPDEVL